MNLNTCRATRQEIDQSGLGERLSVTAESHLGSCVECAQFRTERNSLRELVGSLAPVTAPADFDMRLRARMARERDNTTRQPFNIFRVFMSTPGIAVAAVLVMLVGATVWFNQRSINNQPTSLATAPANQPSTDQKTPSTSTNNNPPTAALDSSNATTDPGRQENSSKANKSTVAANRTPRSSDFAVSSAPSIRQKPERAGEVSLTAPTDPLVVSVRDEHGATRRILLPPVSFGSQRMNDNRVPVSMNNTRDW